MRRGVYVITSTPPTNCRACTQKFSERSAIYISEPSKLTLLQRPSQLILPVRENTISSPSLPHCVKIKNRDSNRRGHKKSICARYISGSPGAQARPRLGDRCLGRESQFRIGIYLHAFRKSENTQSEGQIELQQTFHTERVSSQI
jgi:hypothetical protein